MKEATPTPSLDAVLEAELQTLRGASRLRTTRAYPGGDRLHPPPTPPAVAFCSNDYLGLAAHPALLEAMTRAPSAGSGASRLVNGETPIHIALEHRLAAYLGRPAALLYPTGYLTNLGVISALAGPDDLIVSDAANHASIIDGCRLSRARIQVYPHLDAGAARTALALPGSFRRRLLVTESIFSMDGDRADLPALAAAAHDHDAVLIVDEAHALGVSGPRGRGLCAEAGIHPDVLIGTLGKAFGTCGGFATGSPTLRSYLINRSRPFIYSTAPSPGVTAASLAAVQLAEGPDGDRLRGRAHAVAARLREALESCGHTIPGQDLILPLIVGPDDAAMALAERLATLGLLIPAIRPPTVPNGTARLRITASAAHTDDDIDRLTAALRTLLPAGVSR